MPVSVTLVWNDPVTEVEQEWHTITPIAIGRDPAKLTAAGIPARQHLLLRSQQVSGYHAHIDWHDGQLQVCDRHSRNGTYVNGKPQTSATLTDGDVIQIAGYQITVIRTKWSSRIGSLTRSPIALAPATFPPTSFLEQQQVNLTELAQSGLRIKERDYVTIGGGLGSFIWADYLRLFGARMEQICALGKLQFDQKGNIRPDYQQKPYWNYKQLCQFSQIPEYERLRSNSDSCPDNIWGCPSYALREAWHDFRGGNLMAAGKRLWQVFAEPDLAETYTPRSGNVFASIDREAKRIGWDRIFQYGDARAIRKTTDGRYVIAYSRSSAKGKEHTYIAASYVHVAIGYPALRYLPIMSAYREKHTEPALANLVVNAYENHEHVYQTLKRQGEGMVVIQGRGIVASRIIQKLYELREREHLKIQVIHLMRSPIAQGHRFEQAQRSVKHHQELQPFNWPKACWGGDLRQILEEANPDQRRQLLNDWGGTTTADRQDWQRIVDRGIQAGWYRVVFGEIKALHPEAGRLCVDYLEKSEGRDHGQQTMRINFLIDATGLSNEVSASPLLSDLITHYQLDLNPTQRLAVANSFEVSGMRNQQGRLYAVGAMTLGGPHAAVDSFLGLQYAALRCVDDLASINAPHLRSINGLSSCWQWWHWILNRTPEGKTVH